MTIKFALPTGDPREAVGAMLGTAGLPTNGYEPSSRLLRSVVEDESMVLRIFREKDIPIQVALGSYHLGICGDVWLAEMRARFPLQHLVRIGSLPGAVTEVWLCAAPESGFTAMEVPGGAALKGARIVSELPNLSDALAVDMRIPGYRLMPVYGSADAYPPEDADLVVAPAANAGALMAKGLVPLHRLFRGGLALIANADALSAHDLAPVLARLGGMLEGHGPELTFPRSFSSAVPARVERRTDVVRLAVPDGHAQRHAPSSLLDAGLRFDGYDEKAYIRRPVSNVPGLEVKVVRPQDMPQLVAMGLFDIAISGRDLLYEHLSRFPASPVRMAVDLNKNRYRIGPVVDASFPVDSTAEAVPIWNSLGRPVRIASETPATAERFARELHLQRTAIIPVAGASEGFVPEDADLLIEGSETGTSIRANGLKMLDPFMESTSCVIVRTEPATSRFDLVQSLVERFEAAARAVAVT